MSILELTDDQRFGLAFQDEDHVAFVDALNALHAACREEGSLEAVLMHFDQLVEHSAAHFAREEQEMSESGFFAYACHKGEHDRVVAWFSELRAQLSETGDLNMFATCLETEVSGWFQNHLATMDQVTAEFILMKSKSRNKSKVA